MNKGQSQLRIHILHFVRRNAARIKVCAGIAGVVAFLAFGFFGTANAQNGELIVQNSTNEATPVLSTNKSDSSEQGSLSDNSISQTNEKKLCVYVCGQVSAPGVYYVADGARVCDVIESAQGFLDNASVESINLARLVSDGEQIVVPSIDQTQTASAGEIGSAQSSSSSSSKLINVNTASSTELEQIPGIGQAYAERIISYRTENGFFKSVDELTNVSGIGDKRLEGMRDYICV